MSEIESISKELCPLHIAVRLLSNYIIIFLKKWLKDGDVFSIIFLYGTKKMDVLPGALSWRLLSIPAPQSGKTIDPVRYQDEEPTE